MTGVHHRSPWRAHSVTATAIIALAIGGIGAGPASAVGAVSASDPAPMSISDDGVRFSQNAGGGILDRLGLLIPGESATSSMWVRNDSSDLAVVRVSIRDLVTSSREYADGVSLATWNSGTGQTLSNSLSSTPRCAVIVPSQTIQAGDTMQFDLTFAMADLENQVGQAERARMSLMVAMRDSAGGDFAASACDDDGTLITPTPTDAAPGASSAPGESTPVRSSGAVQTSAGAPATPVSGDKQLPTESVPGAAIIPLEITVGGFTLLRLTGDDLTALLILSTGLASGVTMFVLAARRRREREQA